MSPSHDALHIAHYTLVLFLLTLSGCATAKPLMVVSVPLVDLRAQPHTTAQPAIHDPLEETQLLYGERVQVLKTEDGWAYIEAVEQPEFSHIRRWQGYPGWLPASNLQPFEPLLEPDIVVTDKWAKVWKDAYRTIPSAQRFPLGTRLKATDMGGQLWKVELFDGGTVWLPQAAARSLGELSALPPLEKRRAILRNAQLLLGDRYYWGGRSPSAPPPTADAQREQPQIMEGQVTGVDCSGLVNLAYRTAGVDIPRDAHEQFLRAQAVNALQPADLIFLSERRNPQRVVHVMLYAGEGEVIEGPGTGTSVRQITIAQRLGQSLDWLAPGSVVDEQTIFFGTYFP